MKRIKNIFRRLFLILLLFFLVDGARGLLYGEAIDKASWPSEISIGFIPSLGPKETLKKYQPLIEHLEKSLGVKVEPVMANDYVMLGMGLTKNIIDFAYLSPKTYIDMKLITDCEVIAIELDKDGKRGTYSVLFTSKETGIKDLTQARGKVLAFTSPDSATGYLVPSNYFLKTLKQSPEQFASKVVFAGSHLAVVEGVAKGKYTVGATNDKDLSRSAEILGIKPEQFQILWKSDLIPGAPFVARKGLPESLKKAFYQALLSLSQNKSALNTLGIGGYGPAKDSDFDILRELSKSSSRPP